MAFKTQLNVQKVTSHFWHTNGTQKLESWYEPFNQATVFNYDPNSAVLINKFPVQPAVTIGATVYPSFFTLNLNFGEVNDTPFIVDCQNSSTADCWIIYTQYIGVEAQ